VAEWERSGQDADAFAVARQVKPRTLTWWRWRLRQGVSPKAAQAGLRLVHIDVEPEAADAFASAGRPKPLWELATRRGVLRVHDGIDDAALTSVLAALIDKGTAS
jgi:hypothetical protein